MAQIGYQLITPPEDVAVQSCLFLSSLVPRKAMRALRSVS